MPAWYVYGVTDHGTELPDLRGVDDHPVQLLGEGDLRVAASAASDVRDLEHADPEDVLTAVTRHDEVLVALVREGTVLPVRFGTVLPDADAVADLLADPHGQLAASLAHVHDAEEWVVAVAAPTEDAAPDTDDTEVEDLSPGHAYFAKRRRADHSRQQRRAAVVTAARELDGHLQDLARDMVPMELRDPETVARGAYLVPRRARAAFLDHVEGTTPGVVDVQGPLPPYRFAGTVT